LFLIDPVQILPRERITDLLTFEADYEVNAARLETVRTFDDVLEHRLAGNTVKNFGRIGKHARAFTGREDYDFKRGVRM
jgi:hypothetical protein